MDEWEVAATRMKDVLTDNESPFGMAIAPIPPDLLGGWELVSVVLLGSRPTGIAYWKRRKPQPGMSIADYKALHPYTG